MLPWMWTLALVAGVLLLFGLLLWFLPIGLRVRYQQDGLLPCLQIWVRVLWWWRVPDQFLRRAQHRAFSILGRRLRHHLQSLRERTTRPACATPPPAPTHRYLMASLGRLWRLLRWHVVELEMHVGTGDAASSAFLVGLLRAGITPTVAQLCARGRWALLLEPEYARAAFAIRFDGIWSVRLGQTMLALLYWWRQARAEVRSQRQEAQRRTKRCKSIPFRG